MNLRSKQEVLSKLKNPRDTPPKDPIVEAIRAELEDRDTGIWFQLLTESGPHAIEAQGWQLQEVLSERGMKVSLREVQDAMLQLAHDLLPESAEDPRILMMRDVKAWVNRRPKEDQERYVEALEEDFPEFWEASAFVFRGFLRRCCERAMRGDAA